MAKLIELQEAAKMLGISPDELTEMRSRNEIFGYRDGASWKFKMAEIERVAEEKGLTLGAGDGATPESDELVEVSLDDDDGGESDSILVSDEELGQSDDTTASTIIGEADDLIPSGESDLQIDGGSELRLVSDSKSGVSSDIELSIGSDDVLAGQEQEPGPSDTANLESPSSSEIGDELSLSSDSGSLELSLDDLSDSGSELRLGDSQVSASGASGFGSAIDLDLDDDDLVLGSGSSGSDITSGAGDSGINLANPSDSGLSLEEPVDMAEGSGGELLELGEDDMIEVQDAAGEELPADDDFLLTPVEDGMDEEADSGSQVIALDTEEFDDSAAQMLTEADQGLEEETIEFTDAETPALVPAAAAAVSAESQEAPYTIWNVLSLFFIVVFLGFTGILMLDLMNNIWSWQSNYSFNSRIMEAILAMLPGSS